MPRKGQKSDPDKMGLVRALQKLMGIKLYSVCLCSELNFSFSASLMPFSTTLRSCAVRLSFIAEAISPSSVRKVTYFPFFLKVKPIYSVWESGVPVMNGSCVLMDVRWSE